jgi:hypothetical protein
VDGLLQALVGGENGGAAALAEVASPAAPHVPSWDMAAQGGSAQLADMLNVMHAMQQHHDAVQPAVNG